MDETDYYSYDLPEELIAQVPLPNRQDSRLLLVERATGEISHYHIRDLPEILQPTDCLVVNDTQVVPARLVGKRTRTGGRWQGLFLEADDQGRWLVLCKTRGNPEPGETVTLESADKEATLVMELLAKQEGGRWVVQPQLSESDSNEPFLLLKRIGHVPLPHYIRGGEMVQDDVERYQTVFAERPGAVAAPTAGLHFTKQLLQRIQATGVKKQSVTLHVGVGTFRPINCDRLEDHQMHSEWGELAEQAAQEMASLRSNGGRVIAVGTTVVRTLESAAANNRLLQGWSGETNLFIRPPYEFKAIDGLLTNFHLPRSTLLVLVRTFGGDALMRAAYEEAIRERYRFFSYGDAMLIV